MSHEPAQPGRLAGLRFFLAALVLLAPAAAAHDFWIEPAEFSPAPGRPVGLGLYSGDGFDGRPVPRSNDRIARFAILGADGELPIDGVEGLHPAGFVTPPAPGAYWVVLETRPRRLTLAAEAFESYLVEEGLERIVEARRERDESGAAGRESYRRCAKSLIEAGGAVAPAGASVAGCPLELVLEATPRQAAATGTVTLRLLFRGRPLAGARVAALGRGNDPRQAARTDDSGRVALAVGPGVWLVKAVHMERAPESDTESDWRSWWASLTLRLPATAAGSRR